MPTHRFLREPEAAAYLDLSPKTLAGWRRAGTGPRFLAFGSAIKYAIADLEKYICNAGAAQ